jgi:hypothetical protein
MDRTIEKCFFDIFKQGGIASMCVEILEVKYKLNKSLLNQIAGNSDWEEFYTKTLPEQIKRKACDLNVDFDRLFTEVGKNLSECKTNPTEFSNYCLSLLSPFADFLRKVKPSKHRERERQMKMDDARLLLGSGSHEERLLANDIQSRVEGMIADWENIEKGFWTILQKHTKIPTEELGKYFVENYTETIFVELMQMLKRYAIGLDWILAQNGIDLQKLQNDGGIYLIEDRNIYDYIQSQLAGTKEIAQRVFNALSQNSTQQQPGNKPLQQEYSKELVGLFHGHRELIDELVGKSDNEIATSIKKWAKEKDKFGKPLIEHPGNSARLTFARELKQNGLIKLSEESFRKKL